MVTKKTEECVFWATVNCFVLSIGSSKQEVHRCWLLRLMLGIYATKELTRTGLFHLVTYQYDVNEQLAKCGEGCKFCFTIEDSKAKKLSASGAPGPCCGSSPKPQLPWIRLLFDPQFSIPSTTYVIWPEFCHEISLHSTRNMGATKRFKPFVHNSCCFARVTILRVTDRQTDGWKCHGYNPLYSQHRADKKAARF